MRLRDRPAVSSPQPSTSKAAEGGRSTRRRAAHSSRMAGGDAGRAAEWTDDEEDGERSLEDEATSPADRSAADEDGEEAAESSSDEEPELPPPLAPNRSRRANAGNRMAQLLTEKEREVQEGDEVYETLYGGFNDVENDVNFELTERDLKAQDEEDENSELDEQSAEGEDFESDEDEAAGSGEPGADGDGQRKRKKKKPQLLFSKISSTNVAENRLSDAEQKRRLRECAAIAKANRESLAALRERQLAEQQKAAVKARPRYVDGPKESWYSSADRTLAVVPELKTWTAPPAPRSSLICAISGQPARYVDPLTKLPYRGVAEFRILRDRYVPPPPPVERPKRSEAKATHSTPASSLSSNQPPAAVEKPKKPEGSRPVGRPKRVRPADEQPPTPASSSSSFSIDGVPQKRGRGRPRKHPLPT
ncbi:Vacuolar protein sorting-associated protein 72-like protein [Aphelenchoides fujianensis]|nr:Vacuolar protein sorting-associated protein 72-like protein [Aphelenchoides fujianensis]